MISRSKSLAFDASLLDMVLTGKVKALPNKSLSQAASTAGEGEATYSLPR